MTLTRRRLFGLLPAGLFSLGTAARPAWAAPLDRYKNGDPFTAVTEVFCPDRKSGITPTQELKWAVTDTADSLTNRGMRITSACWYPWTRHASGRTDAPHGPGWYSMLQVTGKLDPSATQATNRSILGTLADVTAHILAMRPR